MIYKEFILENLDITPEQRKSRTNFNEFGTPETHLLTASQLEQIPDIVDKHSLNDFQKSQLALGSLEFEQYGETFQIRDNKILKIFLTESLGTQYVFLKENQVKFKDANLSSEQKKHLDVQARHLQQLKTILKPDIYNQIENFVSKSNANLRNGIQVVTGRIIDDYLYTIMYEIWKSNRNRLVKLPEEKEEVIKLGEKIATRWELSLVKVNAIVNNETLAYPLRSLELNKVKMNLIENEVSLFVQTYEPKGQLAEFPKEVISKMLENQIEQTWGDIQPAVFEFDKAAQLEKNGFSWIKTEQGFDFWKSTIDLKDFTLFFEEFPKSPVVGQTIINEINQFLINYVPKGEILGFPKEVISKMLLYQTSQQPFDTPIFRERIAKFEQQYDMPLEYGGFDPWKTTEGQEFWADVQHDKNWDLFFEKYPERTFSEINAIPIMIKEYQPKGELIGYPKEVISILLKEQSIQDNTLNLEVFENNIRADKGKGGFNWDDTEKGREFFECLITWKVFSLAYDNFPVIPYDKPVLISTDLNLYSPTGQIAEFPKEIIEEMLLEQIHQGNPENITFFEEYGSLKREEGGFSVEQSRLGYDVWREIYENKNFEIFYEQNPERKFDNSHLNNNGLSR